MTVVIIAPRNVVPVDRYVLKSSERLQKLKYSLLGGSDKGTLKFQFGAVCGCRL
jgi:hypothetical protein